MKDDPELYDLYLVATPIGNLNDITLRALEVLRSVDFVAAEDTRRTGLLLKHFGIEQRQLSFHEHNEEEATERILGLIQQGKRVALVSDAGMPGIADPGFRLVRRAIAAGVKVTAIPGPSAGVLALVLSGLAVHSFTFRGFPPKKTLARRRFLEVDQASPHTLIYYESPFRLKALLEDALVVFGDRPAVIANDLTKKFESVQRGTLAELARGPEVNRPRGEYTVVIAGATSTKLEFKISDREVDEQ
ncbi:MAG TPA: 16S rRNA (cytidine(1402)-2'-O)-methyltransferase [Chloroflexota bacterium]|nr:16S rRNA (cytidine(1402)-2'-O)-methyltransferase [Chloroflexota bacterium]